MEGTFVLYIQVNTKGKRYIGITSDLTKRLEAHRTGLSTFTKSRGPWKLVWVSKVLNHSDALRIEREMKRQKGGNGLKALMNKFARDS